MFVRYNLKPETGEALKPALCALKPETAACGMKLETGEALKPALCALKQAKPSLSLF